MGRAEHRVPGGPLSVRWLRYELESAKAGALTSARIELENAGSVTWHSHGPNWIYASYHWLDDRGNPIVWDGLRTPFEGPVPPGGRASLAVQIRAPMPPGRYGLALDLIDEERLWFSELGNPTAELDVDVGPRIARRALEAEILPGPPELVALTNEALDGQEEALVQAEGEALAHLAAGVQPAPDWSRRVLDAHAEGYAAVGGSIEPLGGPLERRRAAATLEPWSPGGGRNPAFGAPLLCPSVLRGVETVWLADVLGLPALAPPAGEPWLYDGRITVRLPSGRRRG